MDFAAALSQAPDADAVLELFSSWARDQGFELYEHQADAVLEVLLGNHAIVSTPTGSGKSLIAVGAIAAALASGGKAWYTAPLKALVSEKFFDLVAIFGADQVGMMTGDSAINTDAPIICATEEVLASVALREADRADVQVAVLDEFHFYADPQRGWAWQVPLLTLPQTQFVLMSATLGDVDFFVTDLHRRTGRDVAVITSAHRPVPLAFEYELLAPSDILQLLLRAGKAPVYLVHFTQAAAVEQAAALLSVPLIGKEERAAISAELSTFRFAKGFGTQLSKLLRAGIGVHHAGMLPRYRRLVERLTQRGLLRIICGTDTLGVGINVPIRTVVLTSLVKYDGERMRVLTAREFHQIAGRAGRAGFDVEGDVVVLAPPWAIEHAKAVAKAGGDERKVRKLGKAKAPQGQPGWNEETFARLRDAAPERLSSHFRVTHAMVLQILAREADPVAIGYQLLTDNHEPHRERNPHLRRAVQIYRSLRDAGVVEHLAARDTRGSYLRLTVDLPANFALNQPLAPFALAALDLLDPQSPSYACDLISVFEATLDDPRQVLAAQRSAARAEAAGRLKAEGYDYPDRKAMIEDITYPRPLEDLLEQALATYARTHPWVGDYELHPKSVVREMWERGQSFGDLIATYSLARSEGVVLRYLADAYHTMAQSIPGSARTEEVEDIEAWLGDQVRSVDSSLLAEWEGLRDPSLSAVPSDDAGNDVAPPQVLSARPRVLRNLVRGAMFRRVELAARRDWTGLGELDGASGWSATRWREALAPYFDEYYDIGIDADARSPQLIAITQHPDRWEIRQTLDDGAGDYGWALEATLDIPATDAAGEVVLLVTRVGPITGAM